MRCTATNLVAVTSARSTRHLTARHGAMTRPFRTLRRGNIRDPETSQSQTKNRSHLNMFIPRNGVTSNEIDPSHLAAKKPESRRTHGEVRTYEGESAHVVSGNAGCAQ